jgi:hypothetical protein
MELLKDKFIWKFMSLVIESEANVRKYYKKDSRYKKLLELKGKYKDKRCFICATGPSLKKEDVELLKNEYTFGVNSICSLYDETDWRPTFYVFQDYMVYESYEEMIRSAPKTMVLLGDPLSDYQRGKTVRLKAGWMRYPLNWAYNKYEMLQGRPFVKFSNDAYQRIYSGYTVTYSAIQLAMYMGFQEIYLLGVDCNYKGGKHNHFKFGRKEYTFHPVEAQKAQGEQRMAYRKALEEAERAHVKIYNVSRGGELDIFERKSLEDVLCEK